jgi:hypothetical protein
MSKKKKSHQYKPPHCLTCGSDKVDNRMARYIVTPGMIVTPCEYYLCADHHDVRYEWHDIYEENGDRKKIDHEAVIKRSRSEHGSNK